jgi:hypothetical protein
MYRKHGTDFVVDVENVWPLIPIDDPAYLAWVGSGNRTIEQNEEWP